MGGTIKDFILGDPKMNISMKVRILQQKGHKVVNFFPTQNVKEMIEQVINECALNPNVWSRYAFFIPPNEKLPLGFWLDDPQLVLKNSSLIETEYVELKYAPHSIHVSLSEGSVPDFSRLLNEKRMLRFDLSEPLSECIPVLEKVFNLKKTKDEYSFQQIIFSKKK